MILPTKRLTADRALLTVGAEILATLSDDERTISQTWTEIRRRRDESPRLAPITYDWFVLALDLLFAIRVIDWVGENLSRQVSA